MTTDASSFPFLRAQIDEELDRLLPEKRSISNTLFAGARYAVLGGGKRLRPLLTLLTVEALGGSLEQALIPACAIELVHTYSLVHDDLPCMDDDDYRRGRPTLHKQFGEGIAVLVGDFLLTYAFELLATTAPLSREIRAQLVEILAKKIGGDGMLGGQMMDLQAEERNMSLDELSLLHSKKTACLIIACIEFGGVLSHASSVVLNTLVGFAEKLGLAFQIWDDILDITDSYEKHGTSTSSDAAKKKCTYASLLGLEGARAVARQHQQQALQLLELVPGYTKSLAALAHQMVPVMKF